jgi:hypothetical protein
MAVLRLTGSILAPRARRPNEAGGHGGSRAGERGGGGSAMGSLERRTGEWELQ